MIRFNHRNQWHLVSNKHPYMFAFESYEIDSNGFVKFNQRNQVQKRGFINITFFCCDLPILVRQVDKGGAADLAGLKVGDLITHVNGESVQSLGFQPSYRAIAIGSLGSIVNLKVHRPSENRDIDFSIERGRDVSE